MSNAVIKQHLLRLENQIKILDDRTHFDVVALLKTGIILGLVTIGKSAEEAFATANTLEKEMQAKKEALIKK